MQSPSQSTLDTRRTGYRWRRPRSRSSEVAFTGPPVMEGTGQTPLTTHGERSTVPPTCNTPSHG